MGFFKKESITEDENISISNEINNTTCDTYHHYFIQMILNM